MKKHIIRSTDGQMFTYEEFETVTRRVESILNSRPSLSHFDENQQTVVLTPGHFLAGGPLISEPVPKNANWPFAFGQKIRDSRASSRLYVEAVVKGLFGPAANSIQVAVSLTQCRSRRCSNPSGSFLNTQLMAAGQSN